MWGVSQPPPHPRAHGWGWGPPGHRQSPRGQLPAAQGPQPSGWGSHLGGCPLTTGWGLQLQGALISMGGSWLRTQVGNVSLGGGGPCPVGCSRSTGGRTSQPNGRCLGCSGEGASVWVPPLCAGDLPLRDQRGASRDRLRVMVGLLLPDGDSGKLPGAEPCPCGAASAHRPPAWERNRLCRRQSSELPDCTGDLADGWTIGGAELSA